MVTFFSEKKLTKRLYLQISETSDLKIGHKLTKFLWDVQRSQRQKVKTAPTLLSHTTAKIIKFCEDNKIIHNPHYKELQNL
jgi:hypothetical protein